MMKMLLLLSLAIYGIAVVSLIGLGLLSRWMGKSR